MAKNSPKHDAEKTLQSPKARQFQVLLTGFNPFAGEPKNASWEVCLAVGKSKLPDGVQLHLLQVPTVFSEAISVVTAAIDSLKPDIIICTGQAGGRFAMSVERVAININDADIPDNAGAQPLDVLINNTGPVAYFSTLPIKEIVAAMHAEAVPAEVSNSAGTFVCNHLMYGVLHHVATCKISCQAGFIHLPYLIEQVLDKTDKPALNKANMVAGIKTAIKTTIIAILKSNYRSKP
jgi:pyroglutamyl-peptidase